MHGTTRGGYANLDGAATSVTDTSGWQVAGTGDFNRDGKPDILWRGTAGGDAMVWMMDGFTVLTSNTIHPRSAPAQPMTLSETEDLDLDGSSDLVWWSPTAGTAEIWLMDGTSRMTTSDISGAPGSTEWTIVPH